MNKGVYTGGNNVRLEVKRIGTCKVDLCGGPFLILHDVLYTQEIPQNIVFVSILLDVGFDLLFSHNSVRIRLDYFVYSF